VHRLLTEKKPFDEHLRMIKQRSEELRKRDVVYSRAHKASIQELQQRLEEESRESRRALREGIRDFNRRIADREADRKERVQGGNSDFKSQKAEMETRVRSMPALCGEPPAREAMRRICARDEGSQVAKNATNQYYQELRAHKEKLAERPKTLSFGKMGRPKDKILEEKKAAGLAGLSQSSRDYSSHLEGLYDKHHKRTRAQRQQHKENFQAHLDHKLASQDESAARREATKKKIQEELAEREERALSRPKGFGGYLPQEKSDKRLMIEAAHSELHDHR